MKNMRRTGLAVTLVFIACSGVRVAGAGPLGSGLGPAVPAQELSTARGGASVPEWKTLGGPGIYMAGASWGNTIGNSVTGSNTIMDGAFNGSGGVLSIIQNTGNQVLIQNAMSVNLTLK